MIDPLRSATTILDYNPELAEALFDVILFVAESEDPKNNPQVDRLMEMVYARTEDSTGHRQVYRNRRAGRPARGGSTAQDRTLEAELQV